MSLLPEARSARAFLAFTGLCIVLAAGACVAFLLLVPQDLDPAIAAYVLAPFVVVGEFLPIPVPRREAVDRVTVSTAFAFALLLTAGPIPACVVYALASAIADVVARTAPAKIAFNVAQYVVSLAAAGAVLALAGLSFPVALDAGTAGPVLLAALACFVVNHVLAGTGIALAGGLAVGPYLLEDLGFQALTAGCLLTLAPGVVTSAETSAVLVPVAFIPVLAIYFGGRQAAINAHRAFHDPLTELPNRRRLTERLDEALESARRGRQTVGVMLLDLDDFKAINDTLGHQFGDRVLQALAPRLQAGIGSRGMLARLGGDEFAVVFEGVREESEIADAAQRLLDALDESLVVDSLSLQISASIGGACYPQHGRSAEELLRAADVALYCAKVEHSTFAIYADEADDNSLDRLALAGQLRRGIERGELVLRYQPKISLTGDHGPRVEALVRWNHPQLGQIGAGGFIPLAEQSGLMKALTLRVLDEATRQCAEWHRGGLDVSVSVNISTRSLLDDDLIDAIRDVLDRYAVPPHLLQLELTESRIVTDVGQARTVLEALRSLGVSIAIDDFGTGFSSLSQLQQLPVDEIKIDRSFVSGMDHDRDDAVLVRSIIDLGRNLGLLITAEGVETASAERRLRELGCNFAQGYHISRPVSAEECRQLFEAQSNLVPLNAA